MFKYDKKNYYISSRISFSCSKIVEVGNACEDIVCVSIVDGYVGFVRCYRRLTCAEPGKKIEGAEKN